MADQTTTTPEPTAEELITQIDELIAQAWETQREAEAAIKKMAGGSNA